MPTFLKGIFAALIALVATTLSTTGLPTTVTGYEILGIAILGTTCAYISTHAVFPSTSIDGIVNLRDILTAIFTAVGAALSSFAGSAITGSTINFHSLLALLGTTFAGIIIAQLKNVAATATTTTVAATTTTVLDSTTKPV